MENELLPCPFCGGEAEMLTAESMHGGNIYGVMCANCAGRSDIYDTEAEAIAAWNTRADYHGYEQAAIEAWESIKAWNTRAEHTCRIECFDDGVDEGMDGEWYSYAPPTWYLSCGHTVEGTNAPKHCSECGARVEVGE